MAEETVTIDKPLGELTLVEYKDQRKAPVKEKAAASETAEETDEEEKDGEQPAKGRGGFQKKIDRLIKQVSAAQEETARERKAREELENKLNGKDAPKTAAPSEDDEPKQNEGETDRDFLRRLTRWEVKQEIKAQAEADARKDAERRVNEIKENYNTRVVEAKSRVEDWEEIVNQAMDIPSPVGHAIMRMMNGPDVAYHLGKNPEIAQSLMEMDELEAIGEIWKISRELAPEKKEEKPKSKAPTPIKPVGASGTGTATIPLDKLSSTAAYRKARGYKPLPKAGRLQ